MRYKFILTGLIMICCFACNTSNVFEGVHKFNDQFPQKLYLDPEVLVSDIPGIVFLSIVDTILLANIYPDPEILLQAYSLDSLKLLGTIIKKGKGPDEFLHTSIPLQFIEDSTGIKAWMFDHNLRCLYLLNISKTIERQRTIVEKKYNLLKLGFTDIQVIMNDSLFWGTSWTIDNLELFVYNAKEDQIISRTKLFKPMRGANYNNLSAYSHGVMVKPDLSKIVLYMLYLNRLQIISLVNPEDRFSFSTSKRPGSFEQIIIDMNTDEQMLYYRDVRTTDQFIFASYNGFLSKDEDKATKTIIHVFDWDGNPVAWIELPHYTPYFALDEKRGFLYGLANGVLSDDGLSEQDVLYRYDIKELLNNYKTLVNR